MKDSIYQDFYRGDDDTIVTREDEFVCFFEQGDSVGELLRWIDAWREGR